MGFHLVIRREGSLLSKVLDQPISDEQLEAIKILIDKPSRAFDLVEDERLDRLIAEHYPNTARMFGLDPYEPDTAPRNGIEQYQAEDR